MPKFFLVPVLAFGLSLASVAEAALVSTLGDVDGFGIPGAEANPADGTGYVTDLGAPLNRDFRDAGDPDFTDVWTSGPLSYTHSYDPSFAAASAVLEVQFAGIHNFSGPGYAVSYNGTEVGTVDPNVFAGSFQAVETLFFTIPVALLTGSDTVAFDIASFDTYSVNFSTLTLDGPMAVVPLPAGITLLGGALLLGGLVARRRKNA